MHSKSVLGAALFTALARCTDPVDHRGNTTAITVSGSVPHHAGTPLEAFVSYSIEFAFFPDFAGNSSEPNTFSNNLLNNLGNLQGTKPYIRVGGNTQDYALYDSSLKTATFGIVNANRSVDYPTSLSVGPSYFESYTTWPNTKFIHGFNLGKNALESGRLLYWELGNEPDLFKTSAQGIVRPASWNEQDYVSEWLNGTRSIKAVLARACPDLGAPKWIAPSFAGTNNSLQPIQTWQGGLDADKDIALISSHNYIGGATQPGVTLQGTLMNHSSTVRSISHQLNESSYLATLLRSLNPSLPFILGETDSLYNEGAPGLSNAFGAALWGVDFNLWCATNNIRRVHMHQGTDYRYGAWQPIETNKTTKGTKPPYYGSIAVAAMMGDLTKGTTAIANLPLQHDEEAAYAAYVGGMLKRVMVINMHEYNYTIISSAAPSPRPSQTYALNVPQGCSGFGVVQRLMANGSDAISGITWNGVSYDHELGNGMAVAMGNATRNEILEVNSGVATLDVPWSSAAMVNLQCCKCGY
ncbi:hypothetical protein B0A49_03722 [Cryomyces minteri]|uniref:Beta-glucuronidase C-terminal domain-containing protein n=1 Tax=Cryomyces minteri TaxID=331657 RepID=A0A4U0XKU8_9PEZI|nr:hypothetical protein B0A49_03722 [Cryomyces minteri]